MKNKFIFRFGQYSIFVLIFLLLFYWGAMCGSIFCYIFTGIISISSFVGLYYSFKSTTNITLKTLPLIYNNFIPFNGYSAMMLFGVLFSRKNQVSNSTKCHETIHFIQMRECGVFAFYAIYLLEYIGWIVYFVVNKKSRKNNSIFQSAYYSISFEQEAYQLEMLFSLRSEPAEIAFEIVREQRNIYNWFIYLGKKSIKS